MDPGDDAAAAALARLGARLGLPGAARAALAAVAALRSGSGKALAARLGVRRDIAHQRLRLLRVALGVRHNHELPGAIARALAPARGAAAPPPFAPARCRARRLGLGACALPAGHYREPWAPGGGSPHRAAGGGAWYGALHDRAAPVPEGLRPADGGVSW